MFCPGLIAGSRAYSVLIRNRVTEQRDRLIELRGYRAGYLVLASHYENCHANCGLPEGVVEAAIRNQIDELRAWLEMTQQELAIVFRAPLGAMLSVRS